MHSYLQGASANPTAIDVWAESESDTLRRQPPGAGRLVLYPGDQGGAEFAISDELDRAGAPSSFSSSTRSTSSCLVDLSAGRSYAAEAALAATASPLHGRR